MEKESQITRRDFLRIAAAATAIGAIGLAVKDSAEGVSPTTSGTDYDFTPLPHVEETPNPLASPQKTIIEFPKQPVETKPKLTAKEIREKQVKSELTNILREMSKHPLAFSKKKKEDIKMYYPIYRGVADKYKLDWYLIFIVHEAETGASAGKKGFLPSSYYKGAMQLDPQWTGSFMDGAAKGLKYLEKLPQRHEDDWKNIATGAKLLSRNFKRYKRLGKEKAVLNALLLYSSDDQALKRFKTYKEYEKFFPAQKKRTRNNNLRVQKAS